MKQLKFMLAAATAISLATAAQAAPTDKTLVDEDFNGYTTDQVVTEITGFSFEGTEGDNESAIIKQAEGDMALKVNTGTDPLLRALDYNNNTGAQDLDFADEEAAINSVTIDTTVEFTVTPEGDTVAATDDDKLLIYLKEETVDEVKSYALRVMTAEYTPAQSSQRPGQDPVPAAFNRMDVKINNKTIEPNKPYSLQVATKRDDDGVVYFEITLDGTKLQSSTSLHPAGLDKFPSRVYEGEKVNTLTYVGFAGEGSVDDLVVTKNYNVPDAVDFTFVVTWDTGISAVAYTISEDGTTSEAAQVPAEGFSVPEGATVELAVTLKDSEWTKLADGTVLKFENVAADKKDINLTTVKIASKVDPETGNVVVNENASVEEVQASASITEGYFAGEVTKAELTTVLNWKSKKGGSDYDINKITFVATGETAGDPETDDAKAYLLDCTKAELATEIQKFVFTSFDAANGGSFKVGTEKNADNGAKYGNGKVEVRGKAGLGDANWSKDCAGKSFFKAFLVK